MRRVRITGTEEGATASASEQSTTHRVPLEQLPWAFTPQRTNYAQRPRLRQGGAGGVVDGTLYLFGGFEDNGHRSNNVVVYEMEAHSWSDLECFGISSFSSQLCTERLGNGPSPRYGHACCIREREIWCFGGQGPEEGLNRKNILGDLSILNLRSGEWRRAVASCAGTKGRVNFLPLPRRGHSLVSHGSALFLYAGAGPDRMYGKDTYFGDLQRLDLKSMCWDEPVMTGAIPEPRAQHAAAVVFDSMVVFGGQSSKESSVVLATSNIDSNKSKAPDTGFASTDVYVLNLRTFAWHIAVLEGTPPDARYGHTFEAHPSNAMVLFLFGGVSANGGYHDGRVHILDFELSRWSTVPLDPIPPRTRHVMCAWKTELMIFGGCGQDGLCVGDVFTIQLPAVPPPTKTTIDAPEASKPTALPQRPQTTSPRTKQPTTARRSITISPIKLRKIHQPAWTSVTL
ncbi:unnamed protein product [Aphanomyces euteiches]